MNKGIRQSDFMKVITATEASRSFATVLDEAERGETIVVARGGKQIAVIGPAPTAPGRMVKAFLAGSVERWMPTSRPTSHRPAKRPATRRGTHGPASGPRHRCPHRGRARQGVRGHGYQRCR
ncbi:type II toxin-antitoxin system Phd/YefM family antitoxin [Nonomuraea bangladeshensis]|uniref:type II toxin-antitoxin system Phd/YefM family antitoxin n=1 Tax=Nonomuraea bangladeshensis TaxID=404385 RepID=UPI003CD068CC